MTPILQNAYSTWFRLKTLIVRTSFFLKNKNVYLHNAQKTGNFSNGGPIENCVCLKSAIYQLSYDRARSNSILAMRGYYHKIITVHLKYVRVPLS